MTINKVKAFILGFRDGFDQPHYVSSSANVDHLGDVYNAQDIGINWGQLIRSPRDHEGQPGSRRMRYFGIGDE